jgi:pimeloyl-ACP methyl ester carboxylesterase
LLASALAAAAAPADPLSGAPSRFAKADGLRIHYKSFGKGKDAVVFVHCWTCDMSFWRFQARPVGARTRVVLLDLPGHGRSDKPELPYTMDLFARAVGAVLRDAGVERAVLVGHSMGAPVVRQAYRLFPEKVRALVVVDGTLRPVDAPREALERFIGQYRGPDHRENAAKAIEGMQGPATPKDLVDSIKAVMLAAPNHVRVSALENMFFDEKVWAPDPIRVPVGAILAESKFWEGYEAYLRSLAPAVDYTVIQSVGHFLQLEKPQTVNEALLGFLDRHGLAETK